MLTRKQYELLVYIDKHLKQTGFSPSFEEMKDALLLKSKSGIHRLISALEERGYLGRRHHRARALEVLRLPDNMEQRPTAAHADTPPPFSPNIIQGDFSARLPGVRTATDSAAVQLPLYGRIAAGLPIEALRDNGTTIDVPMALLGGGEHYALEISGDSMIEAGIFASLKWRMNSMPSMPGMSRSLMMISTAGSRPLTIASAAPPSAATDTCFAPRSVRVFTNR